MKIGLVSDVHADPDPLAEALDAFSRSAVDRIICAGDIAGYNRHLTATIDLLIDHDVDCVCGNHDHEWLNSHADEIATRDYQFLNQLPASREYELAGKRLFVVHAEPPDRQLGGIKLLDAGGHMLPKSRDYWSETLRSVQTDILVVGHTHQVYAERLADTLVLNPGSTPYNHSCMILTLPGCRVETLALAGKPVRKTWNWRMVQSRMQDRA